MLEIASPDNRDRNDTPDFLCKERSMSDEAIPYIFDFYSVGIGRLCFLKKESLSQ